MAAILRITILQHRIVGKEHVHILVVVMVFIPMICPLEQLAAVLIGTQRGKWVSVPASFIQRCCGKQQCVLALAEIKRICVVRMNIQQFSVIYQEVKDLSGFGDTP